MTRRKLLTHSPRSSHALPQLNEIRDKSLRRQRRLKAIIAVLAGANALLLYRLMVCGGSFWCPR